MTTLDEALGWTTSLPHDTVIFIKDSVASPAAFVLHYLLKKILTSPNPSESLIIFVGLNEPFSHYSRIARKQGCNLAAYRERGTVVFLDMLSAISPLKQESTTSVHKLADDKEALPENKLFQLYQTFRKILRREPGRSAWIFIDDMSLLEVVAEGNRNYLLDFLHYCRALTWDEQKCSLVLLAHQDVFHSKEETVMAYQLEYWSDIVINVEPLATGHATDVHGQINIQHRTPVTESNITSAANAHSLHYKITENTVLFFTPGKHV